MPSSTRKLQSWTDQRIERELREFLVGRDEWPSYRDFQRAGRKVLRDAVTQLGGACHWARRLGVTYVERKPGYPIRWTDDRIRRELGEFLRGRTVWPLRIEFERSERKPLRDAVGRSGGPERWAAEFRLSLASLRSGSKRVWGEDRIERELRRFLSGRSQWPSRRAFEQAGLSSMLSAVYCRGGPGYSGQAAWECSTPPGRAVVDRGSGRTSGCGRSSRSSVAGARPGRQNAFSAKPARSACTTPLVATVASATGPTASALSGIAG